MRLNPCWHDMPEWQDKTHQMIGTAACALNYVALLWHILANRTDDPTNASYLIMEDDCLLHQHWESKLRAVMAESLPSDWDVLRIGYWGKTRPVDQINKDIFRVGAWWTDCIAPQQGSCPYYTGNHAMLVSRRGLQRLLDWWAKVGICWTDYAIDGATLKVYALSEKLASELQVGQSRSEIDGNPEVHNEGTGDVSWRL